MPTLSDTLPAARNALTFLGGFSANWSAHHGLMSILRLPAQKYKRTRDVFTMTSTAWCTLLQMVLRTGLTNVVTDWEIS